MKLATLESLELDHTKVGDAGLEKLKPLENLVNLSVNSTAITDAGLEHLKALKLQQLSVADNRITDKGLVHLRMQTAMQILHLEKTKVTDLGVYDLQRALPNLRIFR